MRKFTVLIVDPDEPSALLLEELLQIMYRESADIKVLKTPSAKEAIYYCQEYQIELILTEIHLKEMDGWELTRKIKAVYPSITIIIQTSLVLDTTRQMFRKSGAHGFLPKPINIHEMRKNIHSVLCSG